MTDVPAEIKAQGSAEMAIAAVKARFSQRFSTKERGTGIGMHDGRYCFELHRVCQDWAGNWNVLDASRLIVCSAKVSRALGELIWPFLKMLVAESGLSTWYNGGMESAEDWFEQEILDEWGLTPDPDNQDYELARAELEAYSGDGEAVMAAERIREAAVMLPNQLSARLRRIRIRHPLKSAMLDACDLLKEPHRIPDYADREDWDEEIWENGIKPLDYDMQNTLLWDVGDGVSNQWEHWLNCTYQESGCCKPMAVMACDPRSSEWDTDMASALAWPNKLVQVFSDLNDACSTVEEAARNTAKRRTKKGEDLLINILV